MTADENPDITVVYVEGREPLGRAVAAARGEWLLFTRDDVVPPPDWHQRLIAATRRWPHDGIFGGRVDPLFPAGAPAWLTQPGNRHARWAFGAYAPRDDEGATAEPPADANLLVRTSLLRDARFDDALDAGAALRQVLMRLYRQGEQFVYVPDAAVGRRVASDDVRYDELVRAAARAGRTQARLHPDPGAWPLFGVPPARLAALARGAVRYTLARFGPEYRRWDAALDFHRARGEVQERMRTAEGRRFPGWSSLRSAAKRIGVNGLVLAPLRSLLAPLYRVEAVEFFYADLDVAPPKLPPDITVQLFRGMEQSRDARVALTRMEMVGPLEIERRFARGHSVAVAFHDGTPVGYEWAAFTDSPVPELASVIRVEPDEVLAYDAYVLPAMRGRRIMHVVDTAQMQLARSLGRKRQILYVRTSNRASLHSVTAAGKRRAFGLRRVLSHPLGIDRVEVSDESERDRFPRIE